MPPKRDESSHERALSVSFVAAQLGHAAHVAHAAVSSVAVHHDEVMPGSVLFGCARHGYDPHDHVEEALARGAALAVLDRHRVPPRLRSRPEIIAVSDCLEALRRVAGAWRTRFDVPVIAVAGAAGKTTTVQLLAAVLRGACSVLASEPSWNGDIGVPRTLLQLEPSHDVAVVELGIDEPGAMHRHLELVQPTVALLTSLGPEHLEKLGDRTTCEREELLALEHVMRRGGKIALQLDDPAIARFAQSVHEIGGVEHIGLSLDPTTAPTEQRLRGRWSPASGRLVVDGAGLEGLELALPLIGQHNARNALAAVAVARLLGMTAAAIGAGLASFEPPPGRTEVYRGDDGTVIIGDHYNANPVSMGAALRLLASGPGRRWACLGDMLELGVEADRHHRELADVILTGGIEHVLLVGEHMRALLDELERRQGPVQVQWFRSLDAMAECLLRGFRPGDWVLVKGSRGIRLEQLLDRIIEFHS